jgi:hypothetical protein
MSPKNVMTMMTVMKRRPMKSSVKVLASVLSLSLFPSLAGAGYTAHDVASCMKPTIQDGQTVGGCTGSLKAFRDDADPQTYAALRLRANGMMYFEAKANGNLFTCFFPDTYDAQYFAAFAGDMQHGRIAISARGGVCSDLSMVERGSLYPGY